MGETTIWHNPRCSKSRQTLQILEERGVEPRVIEYLEEPPSRDELERVLGLLGIEPAELLRPKEAAYKEAGLGPESSRDELLDAMVAHPILIERPVVITARGAALGRPPERVLSILD